MREMERCLYFDKDGTEDNTGQTGKNKKDKKKRSLSLKYAAAISASITSAGFGVINSWTSPALPHLTSPASQFPVSDIQGAWIASLLGCGTITGYLLNTVLIDRLGRKRTLLFLAVPQILSWILIYLGRNWIVFCLARIIGGIGYGGGLCATAVYLGEIGDQNTRGIFLTLVKMSINIGIFITMFLGAFLSYNTMNLIILGIPIIFFITFFYMPDSNQFDLTDLEEVKEGLKEKRVDLHKEKTVDVFEKNTVGVLNESTVDTLQESTIDFLEENTMCSLNESTLDALKGNVHSDIESRKVDLKGTTADHKEDSVEENINLLSNRNHHRRESKADSIWWRLFVVKSNQKALLIIFVASLTDIFSGHMAIVSYTQQIFEYSGASLKAEYAALLLGVLKIGASLISTVVVERFGRRVLFLSTGILAGLAQGLVGLFFFLKIYLKIDVSCITWLPLFGVSMYEVVGSIGLSSLYYIYQGELFSDDVKGLGVTCTNIAYEVITFFIKFHFQTVIDAVGIYTLFWGFGISCVIGSGITYWMSPETKGKSKQEIQNLLAGNNEE